VRGGIVLAALAGLFVGLGMAAPQSWADARFVLVQSTTSTKNSGLYDHILPLFKAETGLDVRIVAVGTGQAIRNARNCDGDVLLVHAKSAEEAFVADGFGLSRADLMYNDFVILGPDADPAAIMGLTKAGPALTAIQSERHPFLSRGDDSGTHKAEVRLWQSAGLDPAPDSGTWYRETGSGMGATLNIAVGMGAYTLSDRATWIRFSNKSAHRVLVEGDPALFNQYGIIAINPDRCPNVRAPEAAQFVEWMLSDRGQSAIASYQVDGQQLFFPNAD
jgi:tungstate transport system substrate-binding protein